MQIKNSLLDDLAKTITGAMGGAVDGVGTLKTGADDLIKSHIEKALQDCDVTPHEEHLVLKKLVEKVIAENAQMKQRIENLEKHIKG